MVLVGFVFLNLCFAIQALFCMIVACLIDPSIRLQLGSLVLLGYVLLNNVRVSVDKVHELLDVAKDTVEELNMLKRTLVAELSYAWPPANKEPREVRLQRAAEVQNCLALLGLAGMPLDTRLDTLSGGQQRRVAIATQLARRPTALLLDEPFAGLDWQSRRGLLPLLRAAAQDAGRAVLIVSHDSDELREVADAEYRMEVGGTIARV